MKTIAVCLILVFSAQQWVGAQFIWQTLNAPVGVDTVLNGIDNGNIVGSYYDGSAGNPLVRSFLYTSNSWIYLDAPGAHYTDAKDISGTKIVGAYRTGDYTISMPEHYGFIYENGIYTTLSEDWAEAYGIDGNNIVGSNGSSFLLNNGQYDFFNSPFKTGPNAGSGATGISGNTIVGYAWGGSNPINGYIKNGSNFSLLEMPGAHSTEPQDIQGSTVVGVVYTDNTFTSSKGFLYDGTNWTLLEMPGATSTRANGIDGNTIVGDYTDSNGVINGFILTIPEPSALSLLAIGLGGLAMMRRRRS
jgi:hypothetical protein